MSLLKTKRTFSVQLTQNTQDMYYLFFSKISVKHQRSGSPIAWTIVTKLKNRFPLSKNLLTSQFRQTFVICFLFSLFFSYKSVIPLFYIEFVLKKGCSVSQETPSCAQEWAWWKDSRCCIRNTTGLKNNLNTEMQIDGFFYLKTEAFGCADNPLHVN